MQFIKNLNEVKEKIRAQWSKLTDSDIDETQGNVRDLQSRLKEAYGYDEKRARREFDDFTAQNGLEIENNEQLFHPEDPTISPASPIVPRDSKIFQ